MRCPYCNEQVCVEIVGREGFCAVCGRAWKLAVPSVSVVRRGSASHAGALIDGTASTFIVNKKE